MKTMKKMTRLLVVQACALMMRHMSQRTRVISDLQMVQVNASERTGDTLKGFWDLYLKSRAITWPWLSYMCRVFSMLRHISQRSRSPHGSGTSPPPKTVYRLSY